MNGSTPEAGAWRSLARAAWIAFATHLAAGIAMALVLRHGLDTNRDIDDRLRFIDEHRAAWIAGWIAWNVAALAFLGFVATFRRAHEAAGTARSRVGRLAVLAAVAGVALDLAAESIEMAALPSLARRALGAPGSHSEFLAAHRAAVLMTGFAANGLYTLAVLLLLAACRGIARAQRSAGAAVVAAGVAVSLASLAHSVAGMFWSNAILVPLLLVWLALVARDAAARARAATSVRVQS